MLIIPLTIIWAFAILISVYGKIKITDSLPIASLSLILIAYVVSLLDLLACLLPILVTGLVLGVMYGFYKKSFFKFAWKEIINPGGIAVIILIIILYFLSIDVLCFQGDEYSHWATTVKDMYYSNRLSIYDSSVTTYKTYQPGIALWQYFFLQGGSEYSDGIIIFAYNVYLLLIMAPVFSKITWKNSWLLPLLVIIVYMVPYWYYTPWQGAAWRCIYSERWIAFTFAYTMYVYFASDSKDNKLCMLQFTLGICVLPLAKSIGSAFSLFAIIASIVHMLYQRNNRSILEYLKKILISILPLLLIILSWNIKLKTSKTPDTWETSRLTLTGLGRLFVGHEESWVYGVVQDFIRATCERKMQTIPGWIEVSYIAIPIIWVCVLYLMQVNGIKNKGKSNYILIYVMLIEVFLYQFSVLMTYIYIFPKGAAISLAAFERYSAIYVLGGSWFLFMYLWDGVIELTSHNTSVKIGIVLLMFIFVLATVPLNQVKLDVFEHKKAVAIDYDNNAFTPYVGMESTLSKMINKSDKVYILSYQDLNTSYLMRKIFIPATTDAYEEGVAQSNGLATWEEVIVDEGYTYVYVNKTSEEFNTMHKDFFPGKIIEEGTLYRVNEKRRKLEKINLLEQIE